jgi:hypothetical protein
LIELGDYPLQTCHAELTERQRVGGVGGSCFRDGPAIGDDDSGDERCNEEQQLTREGEVDNDGVVPIEEPECLSR